MQTIACYSLSRKEQLAQLEKVAAAGCVVLPDTPTQLGRSDCLAALTGVLSHKQGHVCEIQ